MTVSAYQIPDGSLIGGRYRVERKLAQGGMGALYIVQHEGTGRRMALKVMHPRYVADAKSRGRFAQEARLGSMIASDHIVEVYDAGVDEERGIPYLAMELLEGETVAARLTRIGRGRGLAPSDAHEVLRQLCSALAAAHARNVVHRDLKPENLFLVPRADGAGFTLKVLDFGIAKLLNPSQSAQNVTTAIGTPLWMAPEQNTTAELTPATDVWAVGLIAFRLLSGRFYWRGASGRELDMAMLLAELERERLPPASERARELGVADDVPSSLDPWFSRCIVRDPAARFQNGTELGAALASAFSYLFPRSSFPPPVTAPGHGPETRPVLAPTGSPNTLPLPQVPVSPMGAAPTQDVVHPPRPPMGPVTITGQPAVPLVYSQRPPPPAPATKPRWWMAAVPALVVLGALVVLAAIGGYFDVDDDSSRPHRRRSEPTVQPAPPVVPTIAPPAVPMPMPALAVDAAWVNPRPNTKPQSAP